MEKPWDVVNQGFYDPFLSALMLGLLVCADPMAEKRDCPAIAYLPLLICLSVLVWFGSSCLFQCFCLF